MRKFIIAGLLGIVGAIACSETVSAQIPNPSSQWSRLVQSNGVAVDVDAGTLVRNGSVVSFWTKALLPIRVKNLNGGNVLMTYQSINCDRNLVQSHASYGLNNSGQVLKTIGQSPVQTIDNSIEVVVRNAVCYEHPTVAAQRRQYELTQQQLYNLQRSRETSAQTIRDAARIGASMFK